MDPSNSHYVQAMMNTQYSSSLQGHCSSNSKKQQEKAQNRPQPEALKCPRCDSGNTKFCYYNNYSLTQPRYFCKACRRYWTNGGSLRNIPVGGGVRKNHTIKQRSSSSSSSPSSKLMMKRSSTTTTTSQSDHDQQVLITTNNSNPLFFNLPNISSIYDTNDLTLAFGRLHKQQTPTRQFGFDDHVNNSTIFGNPKTTHFNILGNPNTTSGFIDVPSTNNGFHYGNMGEVKNSGGGVASHDQQEMGLPYEEINSAKEELLKGEGIINGNQNTVLWNFPWQQFGTDQEGSTGTEREINQCWNNGSSLGSSWHGLVNTTL